jgi:hypothetical protein
MEKDLGVNVQNGKKCFHCFFIFHLYQRINSIHYTAFERREKLMVFPCEMVYRSRRYLKTVENDKMYTVEQNNNTSFDHGNHVLHSAVAKNCFVVKKQNIKHL